MIHQLTDKNVKVQTGLAVMVNDIRVDYMRLPNEMGYVFIVLVGPYGPTVTEADAADYSGRSAHALKRVQRTGIAVQQSSAAVQPRPLGMG